MIMLVILREMGNLPVFGRMCGSVVCHFRDMFNILFDPSELKEVSMFDMCQLGWGGEGW